MSDNTAVTAQVRSIGVDCVAAAARRLIAAVVRGGSALDPIASGISVQLNTLSEIIERTAPGHQQRQAEIWHSTGFRRHDPCSGTENPVAPPLTLHRLPDGSLSGAVALGLPYQGPPGYVHGGVSVLLLDHALGVANARAGTPAMTAQFNLRYLRPVPLFAELTVTARRTSADGRKIRAEGAVCVDGQPHVIADGLWITTPATDQPDA